MIDTFSPCINSVISKDGLGSIKLEMQMLYISYKLLCTKYQIVYHVYLHR